MSKVKILIVEDEEDARKAFVSILEKRGYGISLEASDGSQAISIIEKEKPDIVFLDIQLADNIDGMEVLKRVKASTPESEIIMMSAYESEYVEKAKRIGAYTFLTKPVVKIELFTNIIQEIIKLKKL